ncbi:hypothetical protein E2C01_097154 [Portunus trituberculatus]|uniref:Uncharacterized protein n=1 Tax=Portunus trituberculatus TaxID=210409 RepID=A0A5B7K3S6_PORTR|nr:hypothetical protein [Portunus trituberculatus]
MARLSSAAMIQRALLPAADQVYSSHAAAQIIHPGALNHGPIMQHLPIISLMEEVSCLAAGRGRSERMEKL